MTRQRRINLLLLMASLAAVCGLAACAAYPAQPPAAAARPAPLPTETAPLAVPTDTARPQQPSITATIVSDYPPPKAVVAASAVPTHPSATVTPEPAPSDPAATDPSVYLPLVTKGAPVVSTTFFAVGPGSSDVIPHQIVRTADDRLYIFVSVQHSTVLHVYWTTAAGLPNTGSAFAGAAQLGLSARPLSVDAAYDGGHIVHILANLNSGSLYDYSFDTSKNTFGAGRSLATDAATVSGDYIGSSGVSGMVDKAGTLQVVYWSKTNHIVHESFTYTSASGVLAPASSPTQVDISGIADHPALAVSPVDNSLTVAWVSQAGATPSILARSRTSAGVWDAAETRVSKAIVWTSTSSGINIDQGPSLLIGADGTKHLTYIANYDPTYYGHVHYVSNPGSGWTDTTLSSYSHDPALALNSSGGLYIIGHGHPQSTTTDSNCKTTNNMCTIERNSDGTWGMQQLFAAAVPPNSFDGSPSVKWSVVGLGRPEAVEFVFFSVVKGDYGHPTIWYGRF